MAVYTGMVEWINRILNLGTRTQDDVHKVRVVRQVNGLNLFYTFVAGSISVIFIIIKANFIVTSIQIAAFMLYMTNIYLNYRGYQKFVANFTIYLFEVHLFCVMLYTGVWDSAALPIIILYPLLAALAEVPIFMHLGVAMGEGLVLYIMHRFIPGMETYFLQQAALNPTASEVLSLIGVFYLPAMSAVIMAIIFSENLRARKVQKQMLMEISEANRQLEVYAEQLKDETQKLKAEVTIAKRIQTMVLPSDEEIAGIPELDIACIMRTADEVGGDYYDVIKVGDSVTIGIGDVTGHGLSSGLIMLMAQTAVRTLAELKITNPSEYLNILNRTLYANINRIRENRSMTLAIINYEKNRYCVSGQHESLIICRKNSDIEVIDTMENGFYVGMTIDGAAKFKNMDLTLEKDDILFLYSDGVTEAENEKKSQFGIDNICRTLKKYRTLPAASIKTKFMKDLYNYMGQTPIYDDISMVVIKQN